MQIDSRRIDEGDLFVAVGAGGDFVAHALARGAAAVLVPDDAHVALAAIGRGGAQPLAARASSGSRAPRARRRRRTSSRRSARRTARTVASEGELQQRARRAADALPDRAGHGGLHRRDGDARASARSPGSRRSRGPTSALITNIGPVHLELVETVENVARAKAELIEALPPGGVAVVPEEPLLEPYLTRSDIDVRRVRPRRRARRFAVGDRTISLRRATARHQLDNTLAALTVCDVLGIPLEDGTLEVAFSPLREEELALPGGVVLINDCYNANPISMRAALAHLAERGDGAAPVAVLGEMAELGPGAAAFHREVGAAAAGAGVSELVAVGPLAREYGAGAPGVRLHAVGTAAEAVDACAGCCAPATSCSSRARARWDSRRSRRTLAGARWPRVLVAALVALIISILAGPRFIDFLRRHEFGQQIREEGPEHHSAKQGTPTMGGVLIVRRGDDRVPRDERHTLPALTIFGTMLACGRSASSTTGSSSAIGARSGSPAAGRCCCWPRSRRRSGSPRTTSSWATACSSRSSTAGCRSAGGGTCSSSSSSPARRTR